MTCVFYDIYLMVIFLFCCLYNRIYGLHVTALAAKCTGITAFVRLFIFFDFFWINIICFGIVCEDRFCIAKTTQLDDATKVIGEVMTSSPGPTLAARHAA